MSIDERTELLATTAPVSVIPVAAPKRRLRFWTAIDTAAWIVAVGGAIAVAIAVQVFGFQMTRVLSPSMVPTFDPGDLVIIRPIDTTDLKVGDIPMLPDADDPTAQYVHRIIQTSAQGSEVWVVTKGDANDAPDQPKTIVTEQTPVVVASLPLSKLPTITLSWNWAMILLGGTVLVFLSALFMPSRKVDGKSDDHEGTPTSR